jgi:hypothetical protein
MFTAKYIHGCKNKMVISSIDEKEPELKFLTLRDGVYTVTASRNEDKQNHTWLCAPVSVSVTTDGTSLFSFTSKDSRAKKVALKASDFNSHFARTAGMQALLDEGWSVSRQRGALGVYIRGKMTAARRASQNK